MNTKLPAASSGKLALLAVLMSAVCAAPAALAQNSAASPCAPKRKKVEDQKAATGSPCAPRKKRSDTKDGAQPAAQSPGSSAAQPTPVK